MLTFFKNYRLNERENNFDVLRIFLAIIVFIGHVTEYTNDRSSFIIAITTLWNFSGTGERAVQIFFAISGFLITRSLMKDSNIVNYAQKRIARIFPPIIITVLIMLLDAILLNKQALSAIFTLSSMLMFQDLFGVKGAIGHGAFWTLATEFQFYLILPFLFILFKKHKFCFFCTIITLYIVGVFYTKYAHMYGNMLEYTLIMRSSIFSNIHFFIPSILFALAFDKIKQNPFLLPAIIALTIIFFAIYVPRNLLYPLLICSLTLFYAFAFPNISFILKKFGDISYGIYIYHFPIFNVLAFFGLYKNYSSLFSITVSFAIVVIFSLLSYHLVEKKIIKYSHKK